MADTARVRSPKTAELVAAQIRSQIVRREYEVGEPLPTEQELLDQLGVSVPTLREAYRILESESLIVVKRGAGGGVRVAHPDIRVTSRYVGLLLQLGDATIADVYQARTEVESLCAEMMATRSVAADVADLHDCAERVNRLIAVGVDGIPEARAWARTTYQFHELVLARSGNKTLAALGGLLAEVVSMHYAATALHRHADDARPARFRRVFLSFRKLIQLVELGDGPGAYEHWLIHMQTAAATLLGDDLRNQRIVDLFT